MNISKEAREAALGELEPEGCVASFNPETTGAVVQRLLDAQRLAHEKQMMKLRDGLEKIIAQQPCCEGGSCFYPMTDGEGNPAGEQNVDPLGVIQSMVQIAQETLNPEPQ